MINVIVDNIEYRFYDHLYAVSSCGKVLRALTPYTPSDNRKDGYLSLGRKRLMHRVVAICWLENPENKKHVHHINGNKKDNRAINLQWLTPKEHIGNHHNHGGTYKRTPETIEKLRKYATGRKYSDEANAKKQITLDLHRKTQKCKFNGEIFNSLSDGAKAANMRYESFRVRCRSKNFPNYELL